MSEVDWELERKNNFVNDFFRAEKSHIDLSSDMVKGDLGLADYALASVSYDTVVLNMIDQDAGQKKEGKFIYSANTDVKAWRIGQVIMVGDSVKRYKVGDYVSFPGVKGLDTGSINIENSDGTITKYEQGYFIAETNIHGKVKPIK